MSCLISKCVAEMKPDYQNVELHFFYQNGTEETRTISLKDYIRSLQGAVKDDIKKHSIRIPELPKGYLGGTVSIENPDDFSCAIGIPKGIRYFRYYDEEMAVPFPNLVFLARVKERILVRSSIIAVESDMAFHHDSRVFRYPYGNVYADDHICWGTNVLPMIDSMKDLNRIVGLFFGSSTNMDLYSPPNDEKRFVNQRGLLEAVMELPEYPDAWLKNKNTTLRRYLDQFFNKEDNV